MNLYQIREAIRTETDEARLTELLIERDRLVAIENAERVEISAAERRSLMLDHTFN